MNAEADFNKLMAALHKIGRASRTVDKKSHTSGSGPVRYLQIPQKFPHPASTFYTASNLFQARGLVSGQRSNLVLVSSTGFNHPDDHIYLVLFRLLWCLMII